MIRTNCTETASERELGCS